MFCCGGLGADGYASVFGASALHGFDTADMSAHYPYNFTQGDALKLLEDKDSVLREFDAFHLSPPCQEFTTAGHLRKAQGGTSRFGDLLTPTLSLLRRNWNHTPWVVENVDDNQKKVRTIMEPRAGEFRIILCATVFGLPMWRHRVFLSNFPMRQPSPTGPGVYGQLGCRHDTCPVDPVSGNPRPWGVSGWMKDNIPGGGRTPDNEDQAREVMGSYRPLPWDILKEGIPPAYTSWIGADLLRQLELREELL